MMVKFRKGALLGAVAVLGGAAISWGPTSASAASIGCTSRTTAKYFSPWGDQNLYFAMPQGTFESGTPDWSLGGGAKTTSENEPWKVTGSGNATSLQLPNGSSAVGPTFCVNTAEDSLRTFVKRPGISGAKLRIHVEVTSGVNRATSDIDVDGSTAGWTVINRMMLPDIRDASGQQWVSIWIWPSSGTGTWKVDDIMIDPWKTM